MDNQKKSWLLGIFFGIIGVILANFIFIKVIDGTGIIFGLVSLICGGIAGGLFGLGFMTGKAELTLENINRFFWVSTIFGLMGVIWFYLPSWMILTHPQWIGSYYYLLGFNGMELLFLFGGALGGRMVGKKIARIIILTTQKDKPKEYLVIERRLKNEKQ